MRAFTLYFDSTPSPGFYNDDDVPDFLVKYAFGPGFPVYYHSVVSYYAQQTLRQVHTLQQNTYACADPKAVHGPPPLDNHKQYYGLSPQVKYFYLPFKGGVSFLWLFMLCLSCLSCFCYAFVRLVVTCWERADLLALVCYVLM